MRVLICEDKFSAAAKQFPDYAAQLEALRGSSLEKPAKYIGWFIKRLKQLPNQDASHIIETLKGFEQNVQRLTKKDIDQYENIDELRAALNTLGVSTTSMRDKAKTGAKLIWENARAAIYHITTKEASQYYGRQTKWCIAATSNDNAFDGYVEDGISFFFVIAKQPTADPDYQKIALQVDQGGNIEGFWTADDTNQGEEISATTTTILQTTLRLSRAEFAVLRNTIRSCTTRPKDVADYVKSMSERQFFRLSEAEAVAFFDQMSAQNDAIAWSARARLANLFDESSAIDAAIGRCLATANPGDVIDFIEYLETIDIEMFEDYFISHPSSAADQFFSTIPGVDKERYVASLKKATRHFASFVQVVAICGPDHALTPDEVKDVLGLFGEEGDTKLQAAALLAVLKCNNIHSKVCAPIHKWLLAKAGGNHQMLRSFRHMTVITTLTEIINLPLSPEILLYMISWDGTKRGELVAVGKSILFAKLGATYYSKLLAEVLADSDALNAAAKNPDGLAFLLDIIASDVENNTIDGSLSLAELDTLDDSIIEPYVAARWPRGVKAPDLQALYGGSAAYAARCGKKLRNLPEYQLEAFLTIFKKATTKIRISLAQKWILDAFIDAATDTRRV